MKAKRFILMLLILVSVMGAWAENEPCQHTFNAVNDVCDKCGHGFLFYEAGGVVVPFYGDWQLYDAEGIGLEILSNTCVNGKGVIELDRPLVIIGGWAFWQCQNLTDITIGNSVTTIGESAFEGCCNLSHVNFGNSVKTIGERAFIYCDLNKIVIPNSVTRIDNEAFICNYNLTEVDVMWHSPIQISSDVFEKNVSGVNLVVPETALANYQSAEVWNNFNIITKQHTHEYSSEEPNICITCGYKQHIHNFSEEWKSDDTHHWHACVASETCTERGGEAVHQYDGGVECVVCGRYHRHELNESGECTFSGCIYKVSDVPSGFFTAVSEYGDSQSDGDGYANLFDGETSTRWTSNVSYGFDYKGTVIFKIPSAAAIYGYSMCTYQDDGNDYYHPKAWTLSGYDETTGTWEEIHHVYYATLTDGWNNYRFANNDNSAYTYFKLEITKLQEDHPCYRVNIGELTLDMYHEHNYEWVVDEHQHKQVCKSEVGTCNARETNVGAHTYDEVAEPGTESYYTCSVCRYIDPVRQHVHNYATEWSTDGTHHWHACTSEVGTCTAKRKDEAEHNIHESILCDTDNYMCDVCQYVDVEKKAQFGADRDYLSMTAVGGDVRIGFKNQGTPDSYTIQVSEDGNHWSEPQTLNTETTLATIPEGETYYLRHGSTTAIGGISTNQNNHWSFTMTGDGTIEADGNIISLIDATCQKNSLAGSPQHVFTALFKGCERLTVAPALPFLATGEFNYMYMFEGTGISVAPQLPATTAVAGVYMGMFKDCKKLETVPILPATTVGRRGYEEMFYGCEKLKTVEIANITIVTSSADGAFTNWLTGTAADTDGKLIAPLDGICNTKIPAECIPSNWQWATKLKANEDPDNDGNFYTTFFDSRYDYKVEDGFKAYSGIITTTEDDERELGLKATPNKIIPKGDGVIIHGGSGEVLLTVSDGSATKVAGNVLTGSDTDTTVPDFCYILSYGQQRLGFYRLEEGKALSAHKAYLTYQPFPGVRAKALRMVFVDEETGIEALNDGSTSSPIGIYSVSGVRQNKLQKGINIVNGRKIIVK